MLVDKPPVGEKAGFEFWEIFVVVWCECRMVSRDLAGSLFAPDLQKIASIISGLH